MELDLVGSILDTPWGWVALAIPTLILILISFIWLYLGVYPVYSNSLRAQIEHRYIINKIYPENIQASMRFYKIRQLREIMYEDFGNRGVIGQGLVAFIGVFVVVALGYVTAVLAKDGVEIISLAPFHISNIRAIWQVQATILTLAFVIAVFFWQSLLERSAYSEELRTAIRYTHSLFGVSFSLLATVVSGLFIVQNEKYGETIPSTIDPTISTTDGFVILFLSTATIFVIFLMYRRSLGYLVFDESVELNEKVAYLRMDRELKPSRADYMDQLLNERIGMGKSMAVTAFVDKQIKEITASDIDMNGTITDVNMKNLENLIKYVENSGGEIESIPTINTSAENDPVILTVSGDMNDSAINNIKKRVNDSIVTRRRIRYPW